MVCSLKHDFKAPVQYLVRGSQVFHSSEFLLVIASASAAEERNQYRAIQRKKVLPVTMGKRPGQGKRSGFYNRARNPTLPKVLLIH